MNWAEDALQVMSQARVCLAPLRWCGIKGKLVDAMLCGTPNVTAHRCRRHVRCAVMAG
jgi:glycosyltransferase involved in cell wall biosynthesis